MLQSGVSNQPFGDLETKLGAQNRAQAAYEAAISSLSTEFEEQNIIDFAVGLEGGLILEEPARNLWCMAWMAILKNNYNDSLSWGFAKTASFLLPDEITRLVLDEKLELGE